jgi:hypothetical protein
LREERRQAGEERCKYAEETRAGCERRKKNETKETEEKK